MRVLSLALVFVAVFGAEPFETPGYYDALHTRVFRHWKTYFNKKYDSIAEEAHRFTIFVENWRYIDSVNAEDLSYKLGLNQFADLTGREFKRYVHGKQGSCLRRGQKTVQQIEASSGESTSITAPASIDWTTKGVVTPVKDQGQCGSCWAFSATGAMESRYAIAKGKLVELSEQQIVDCDRSGQNDGCNGGFETDAMKYAAKAGGLCSEQEYPYTSGNGKSPAGRCKASSCGTKFDQPKSATYVTTDSVSALVDAVAVGPVSIGIDASQNAFQFYRSGILSGRCGKSIDHAVLVVGYGEEGGKKYWKVKNSWNTSWGERGYVRICKECNKNGKEGECGILSGPSYPDY